MAGGRRVAEPGLAGELPADAGWFFEQFCRKRAGAQAPSAGAGASASPSVGLAREYVELQRLERAPGPAQLQEWQDALNWLFRWRGQRSGALTGVPPLGRADLGRTPWEPRLVETIRARSKSKVSVLTIDTSGGLARVSHVAQAAHRVSWGNVSSASAKATAGRAS